MPKMLAKAWLRVKCVDEGDVGVGAEDVSEAPHVEVLAKASCCSCRRYVVGVDVGDVGEAPLLLASKVSYCSH